MLVSVLLIILGLTFATIAANSALRHRELHVGDFFMGLIGQVLATVGAIGLARVFEWL